METVLISEKTIKPTKTDISNELIYEIIDGQPVYYAGYKDVLNKTKTIQDIMGSSGLQSTIIDLIVEYFHRIKFEGNLKYQILYSELGLHVELKNNFAADIAIYNKADILDTDISDNYMSKPPRVIIEVDTKADVSNFNDVLEYIKIKTEKLLNFGTEKILWVLTKSKKIIVISESKKWYFASWGEEIDIIDNLKFTLQTLINENGTINE
jgi:hypothetical protein